MAIHLFECFNFIFSLFEAPIYLTCYVTRSKIIKLANYELK